MENAAKALVIAGAILISIILISIGVMVVNSANALVDEGQQQMDQQAVNAFNSKFLNYQGTRVRGSNVKTLIQTINSSNANSKQTESEHIVMVDLEGTTSDTPSALNISSSKYYQVEVTDYYLDGAIKEIKITASSTSGGGTTGGDTTPTP